MEQSAKIGDILDNRYEINSIIAISPEQDMLFSGKDIILKREINIIVATPNNSELLKSNAKKIALLSEKLAIKILDLGNVNSQTYLITNKFDSEKLLEITLKKNIPEPQPNAHLDTFIKNIAKKNLPKSVPRTQQIPTTATQENNTIANNSSINKNKTSKIIATSILSLLILSTLAFTITKLDSIQLDHLSNIFPSNKNIEEETNNTEETLTNPEIKNISLIIPNSSLQEHIEDLPKLFDNNPQTIWSTWEYFTENWGNYTPNGVNLVIELKQKSHISQIKIIQSPSSPPNGIGGKYEIKIAATTSEENSTTIKSDLSFNGGENIITLENSVETDNLTITISTLPPHNNRFALNISEIYLT